LLPLAFSLGLAVANGMIGFIDDYRKLVKKENEGLGRTSKLILQLTVAVVYLVLMKIFGTLNTALIIPFANVSVELGIFYYILAALLIAGFVNATNITDGIDGLASSVTFVVLAFFSIVAFRIQNTNLAILSAAFIGAILGFLVFNRYPAKVFMGDTGSLFIGGFLMGMAFMINNPLILIIAGMVYVLDMLSSFLQIFCYKVFHGKRLFSIAPFHHALEKRGWSENKVVCLFTLATLIGCVLGFFAG
jgi:phospho-N-acetylmuramoyl-pentapeptide-transferase